MLDIIRQEATWLWYYADLQFRQLVWYWLLGMALGSLVSVFAKAGICRLCLRLGQRLTGPLGWVVASLLGIASPLCMYGTIPLCASFAQRGLKEDFLGAFMMSSILLNPQLLLYTAALGRTALCVRLVACFLCGVAAGALLRHAYRGAAPFLNFQGFEERAGRDTHPHPALRLLFSLGRNVRGRRGRGLRRAFCCRRCSSAMFRRSWSGVCLAASDRRGCCWPRWWAFRSMCAAAAPYRCCETGWPRG